MSIDFFSKRTFEDIFILYLYKENPDLIDYSYYKNFKSNILFNREITTDIQLEDIPLVTIDGDKIDIQNILENRMDDYSTIRVESSEIEYYFDYVEKNLKKEICKKVYDRVISAIEKETGMSYPDILKKYSIRSLSDAIKDLNHDSKIDDLYDTIERCFLYSYDSYYQSKYYKEIVNGIEEYADELGVGIDTKKLKLYDNEGQLFTTVGKLIEIFKEYGDEEDYGNYVLDVSDFESLFSTYVDYMTSNVNNIRIDFDHIYGNEHLDNDVISSYILDEI
jgi:hypothetical protein